MYLVTAANSKAGRAAVAALSSTGHQVRALVHQTRDQFPEGVEVVHGDLLEPESVAAALEGVTGAVFIAPPHPQLIEMHHVFAQAAVGSDVACVVKQSVFGAAPSASVTSLRAHWQGEEILAGSELNVASVRPMSFMQNLIGFSGAVKAGAPIATHLDDGRIALCDARDVGAVLAALVSGRANPGRVYDVTGPHALTMHEVAAAISRAIGRDVPYQVVPAAQFAGLLEMVGVPAHEAEAVVEHWALYERYPEYGGHVVPTIERITGHKPRSFDDFLQDFGFLFSASA